jgi:hypothetical protein
MPGKHFKEVETKLGKDAIEEIMQSVRNNVIDKQKMLDMARVLGGRIGGSHEKRMEDGAENNEAEMRNIFSDMYGYEKCDWNEMTKKVILKQLIALYEKLSLRPLANKLRKFLIYENEVKELLGKEIYDHILNSLDTKRGIQLKDAQLFAYRLKSEIGEKFQKSTKEQNFQFDRQAIKEILSYWYETAEVEEHEGIADKIINIFHDDLGDKAMAKVLKKLKRKESPDNSDQASDKGKGETEDKKREWMEACKSGNMKALRDLIDEDKDRQKNAKFLNDRVTTSGTADSTPLAIAALNGQNETVRLLLKEGAKASHVSSWTPLEMAIIGGHYDTADIFLENGVDAKKELHRPMETYRRNATFRREEGLLAEQNYVDQGQVELNKLKKRSHHSDRDPKDETGAGPKTGRAAPSDHYSVMTILGILAFILIFFVELLAYCWVRV